MNLKIGNKIKKLRLENNITQDELCGNFLNRTVLSKIENNKIEPSISQLKHISNKLNIQINYFFIEEEIVNNKTNIVSFNRIKEMYNIRNYSSIIKLVELNKIKFAKNDFIQYYFIGMSYFNLGINKDSLKYLKKFTNNYNKSSNETKKIYIRNFAIASNSLYKIMLTKYDYLKAKNYLIPAIKQLYLHNLSNSYISFIIHNNLAHVYNKTSNYKKTITLLEFLLNTNKELLYINIIPDIHLSLNIAYYNIQKYDKSIEHIKKSIFFYNYIEEKNLSMLCYLNFINAERYSENFHKAFDLIQNCKKVCANNKSLMKDFLIQESIINFNLKNYNKCLQILNSLKITKLKKDSKNNYIFMKGYIDFINKDYEAALINLKKCENFYIQNNYSLDLYYLYDTLYKITKDTIYKNKSIEYKNKIGRKNIF